jgi:hypothetical protein
MRLFTFAALLGVPTVAAAADPVRAIPYSGSLEVNGQAPNASLPMAFALWDAATAGNRLFQEPQTVPVTGGVFAVVLGAAAGNPLPESVFTAGALFVEVTVDATTLAPRQQVYAAPQAIRGRTADSFAVTNELSMGVPAGASTIRGNYRLHISSEEVLYLLAKGGVQVSSAWGGTGSLGVEGGLNAGSLTAGTLAVNSTAVINGAVAAGSVTIGDLQLRASGGTASQLSAANSDGHLFIDNRPTAGGLGGLFLNYTSQKPVVFGNWAASVDGTTGAISAKGTIKAHNDQPRCTKVVDSCGVQMNVTCPNDMFLTSIFFRADCLTAWCCYVGYAP